MPNGLKNVRAGVSANWASIDTVSFVLFCFIISKPYLCGGIKIPPFCCRICFSSLVVIS